MLLDAAGDVRYRGRIDDGYVARLKRSATTTRLDLNLALDAVLAGKPVEVASTPAVGCPIARPERKTIAAGAPTYHRDVAPILQARCQGCHRPGEVGPFALTNYAQAVRRADDLKAYTANRAMPPWKPTGDLPFAHPRAMPDAEIATLAKWVDGGTPEGNAADAPPAATFTAGWQLGPPDLVLTAKEPFTVGSTGSDLFRCFVLPTGLTEDRHVVAFEVKPGNPRVVHHTLNFFDTQGRGRAKEADERTREKDADDADRGPGYSVRMGVGFAPNGALSGWAPGQMPRYLPEGVGYFLPKHSDLIVQVHYHRTGRVEQDTPSIGLYFAKGPIRERMQALPVGVASPLDTLRFTVPAGKADHVVKRSLWLQTGCVVHSVMPHMHLLGKTVRVTMTPPGGPPVTLVRIDEWDYNWQETYWLAKPVSVTAGTRFDIEAVYDNSPANPHNPNRPPRAVRFGEQTTNEMLFGFVGATNPAGGRIRWTIDGGKK